MHRILRRLLLLGILAGGVLSSVLSHAGQRVFYPGAESSADARRSYPLAVLNMCQDYLHGDYEFRASGLLAQQQRNLLLLEQGELDILWTVSTVAREQKLLPVRIPIDRGLIGWRLLLVRQGEQEQFASLGQAGLSEKIAGQGHDWPDLAVLRANGFAAQGSSTYEGLFAMLARGHIDYFPRSVSEIWPELSTRPGLGLAVASGVALHYPEQLYFFVNRRNTALAAALTSCLRKATEDGALKRLFYQYFGEDIALAGLLRRRIVQLQLPEQIPPPPELADDFWFRPGEAR